MDFTIDKAMRERLDEARECGRREVRPIGLEADRLGRPIPTDDPYFASLIARGEGRTRWPGPDGKATRIVSPTPRLMSCSNAIRVLITPSGGMPASVTPKCNGTSGRSAENRWLSSMTLRGSESLSETQN